MSEINMGWDVCGIKILSIDHEDDVGWLARSPHWQAAFKWLSTANSSSTAFRYCASLAVQANKVATKPPMQVFYYL